MPFYTKTYSYKDLSSTQTTTQVSSVAYSNVISPITFGYTYNAVGNILTHSQTGEGTITYTYDSQGQLLKAAGDTTYTYTYDNVGNILTASNGTTTHRYTYGNSDWKDLLTAFDDVSITYDNSGNPLSYYNGTSWGFTWAAGRRLMSATGGGNTINFSYNEDGSRASKTVNGTRHNYTWDGQTLVRDYYGNTILDFSYDANGQPYSMHYNSTPYFYILNLQGDVIRMVDGNGNTVASYEYDPYGRVISATGSMAEINPLRYRGYYYDSETQLYHLWSRYYDPQTGRFISADEFSSTGQGIMGYNMFAYCMNNPVNRFDANGNWSLPNWAKIAIGAAAIAVGVIATAATGGAAAPVLVASLKIAATSAAIGAVSGAGISAVNHRVSTGSWEGAGKAAVTGAIDGACDGFMWGGITAGASFTTVAAKGIKVKEIGKLKPSNKPGDGYSGVKYQAPKANGKYTTRSIELHSPHKSGPHNVWHWQQNTWNPYNNSITGSAKHWTIWGKPL